VTFPFFGNGNDDPFTRFDIDFSQMADEMHYVKVTLLA